MSLTGGIELSPLKVQIQADIKGFKSEMEKAKTLGVTKAKEISKSLSDVTKVGESLEKAGKNLTKFVTLPLAGIGAGALKMAVDFESSFAKVSTLLDDNIVNFDEYKKDVIDASNKTKVAVGEFSEAVYQSISAGVDQTKAIEFTTEAMKLAKGGFTDGAKAVDVLTTAINAYNLTAEDSTYISDLLITTQNLGKTTVDELAESMGKVIPVAKNSNFNLEELSASYAVLTKNGIQTAEATTYLKAMLSELSKSGSDTDKVLKELSGKGFAELKAEGKGTVEILTMLDQYAKSNGKTLKDMFGSVEAGTAALVLMNEDGAEYNEMLKAMQESAGATQAAFEKMDATPAEQFKGALNELKNAAIELGVALIPAFKQVAEVIKDLARKFSGLSEEQKENIVKWGAMAMAVGPVLSIIGKGLQTFVTLKSAIGGISTGLGAFTTVATKASVGTTTLGAAAKVAGGATGLGGVATGLGGVIVAAAPYVLAAAAIAAAGYAVYKGLTAEVIPSVDLFGDVLVENGTVMTEYGEQVSYTSVKISEATKEAVGAYVKMDEDVTKTLNNLYYNSTVITQETCTNLVTKYDEMGKTITAGLEEDKLKDIEVMGHYFTSSVAIQEDEKVEILKRINELYGNKEKTIAETQERILEILTKAKDENRELTAEEVTEINELQAQMKEQAIKTLSENEVEANAILERMKGYSTRITAEQSSENIKKLNENRDKSIAIANNEYDERIRTIIRLRDEAGVIGKDQADKMIAEATRQRDETIKKIEDTRVQAIDKMRDLNKDLDTQVNTTTGAILTAWDKLKRWWSGWTPETKDFYATVQSSGGGGGRYDYMSHYNGLEYVPYDGYMAKLHKGERVLTAEENKNYFGDNNNSNLTIKIDNFINNREMDIKAFAEELEFYRRQVSLGGGRA